MGNSDNEKANAKQFLSDYFKKYRELLLNGETFRKIEDTKDMMLEADQHGGKVLFFGNGASAAISSHAALDFTKQAGIESLCFNDSSILTAFSNDFGYENWVQKALEYYVHAEDVVVLISSSGSSQNIVNGAQFAKSNGLSLVTFSGFEASNPLKGLGDINFWVDSKSYNVIENIHQIWLMAICDLIIGESEYSVS